MHEFGFSLKMFGSAVAFEAMGFQEGRGFREASGIKRGSVFLAADPNART